jgi:hypothetical protein
MTAIAELIARVVVRGEDPAGVKRETLALRSGFQSLHYCFEAR